MSYKASGMFGEDSPLTGALGVIGVVICGASLVKMGYEFGCSHAKKMLKLHKKNTKEMEKREQAFYHKQEQKERQRERELKREAKKYYRE
jgi:hypothetical protein